MVNRAHFMSCELELLLGKAQAYGIVEALAATSHAILIPGRANAVRVWVGATVAGPRSLTGGHGCSGGLAWNDVATLMGLADTSSGWVNGYPALAGCTFDMAPHSVVR